MGVSMNGPTECKWCGCSETISDCEALKHFRCGPGYWSGNDNWHRGTNCTDNRDARLTNLRYRIQRAVDELKAATRYTVENGRAKTLWWDTNPDGYVTDSKAVDEAIAILEGERDEP